MKQDDLEKGLAALKSAAETGNANTRRALLFQKAQDGAITKEENDELVKALHGGDLAESAVNGFVKSDTIQKSTDISDTLREYVGATVAGLEVVSDRITKSENNDQGFRIALATTLHAQGEVMKSMANTIDELRKSVESFGGQPARGPKSQLAGQPQASASLEKSMVGADAGAQLGREQILDGMSDMISKGQSSVESEDLLQASTKYEGSGMISKSMLDAVTLFTREQTQA